MFYFITTLSPTRRVHGNVTFLLKNIVVKFGISELKTKYRNNKGNILSNDSLSWPKKKLVTFGVILPCGFIAKRWRERISLCVCVCVFVLERERTNWIQLRRRTTFAGTVLLRASRIWPCQIRNFKAVLGR